MNCNIFTTPTFLRDVKSLAKKYPSLRSDLEEFANELKMDPLMGTPLGHHLRKVRISIASKGKGKSGVARVITHTIILSENGADVSLLTIYDKSEQSTLSDSELVALMQKNGLV